MYASAQSLDFLAWTKNSSFPNRKRGGWADKSLKQLRKSGGFGSAAGANKVYTGILDANPCYIRWLPGGRYMKTVLICDDEPLIRMSLRAMLKELGFEDVLECGDGKSAVEMAMASFPDMAVLDVAMPEMDGITAAKEIKKKLKIPILLLTNCFDAQTAKRAAESGIAAFLTKPLREQDLIPAIEIALAHTEQVEDLKEKIEDLKETIENRKVIEKAKGMMMEKQRMGEADAYRTMQKMAMDKRKSLRQVADGILKGVKIPIGIRKTRSRTCRRSPGPSTSSFPPGWRQSAARPACRSRQSPSCPSSSASAGECLPYRSRRRPACRRWRRWCLRRLPG